MSASNGDRRSSPRSGRRQASPTEPVYAALDLGTNNCRLLVVTAAPGGFRVVASHSRIVRLGEGLARTGALAEAAMDRTIDALRECARTVAIFPNLRIDCIATQACRVAENGVYFLDRVRRETGFAFRIVTAEEEARLAARGCISLVDPKASVALVVDVGGGSTELAFVDAPAARDNRVDVLAWASLPIGVVELSERMPETGDPGAWYAAMVADVEGALDGRFARNPRVQEAVESGAAHILGTSGAVSSLAGVFLKLERYQRSRVDGLWMRRSDLNPIARELLAMSAEARAVHPCIGPSRGDLVLPGCAILEAICNRWPIDRVRVADRGLREGVLLDMIDRDRAQGATS